MTIYKATNQILIIELSVAILATGACLYISDLSKYENILISIIFGIGMFLILRLSSYNYTEIVELQNNIISVKLQNGKKLTFNIESIQSMEVEGYGIVLRLQNRKHIVIHNSTMNYYDLRDKLESFNIEKKKQPIINNKVWGIIIALLWFSCAFILLLFGIIGIGIHPIAYYISALVSFLLGVFSIWLFLKYKQ